MQLYLAPYYVCTKKRLLANSFFTKSSSYRIMHIYSTTHHLYLFLHFHLSGARLVRGGHGQGPGQHQHAALPHRYLPCQSKTPGWGEGGLCSQSEN